MAATIRVVLADDHPHIRAGLKKILAKADNISLVGEAADGCRLLELVKEQKPEVILADIEMPGINGIHFTQKLREMGSKTPVILISAYDDTQFIQALFAVGVTAYVVKEDAPEKLVGAIFSVIEGRKKRQNQTREHNSSRGTSPQSRPNQF